LETEIGFCRHRRSGRVIKDSGHRIMEQQPDQAIALSSCHFSAIGSRSGRGAGFSRTALNGIA
jgi:hypothetical protein